MSIAYGANIQKSYVTFKRYFLSVLCHAIVVYFGDFLRLLT